MLRLPAVTIEGRTIRLPLSEPEACAIIEGRGAEASPAWVVWRELTGAPEDGLNTRAGELLWLPISSSEAGPWTSWLFTSPESFDVRVAALRNIAYKFDVDARGTRADEPPPPFARLFIAALSRGVTQAELPRIERDLEAEARLAAEAKADAEAEVDVETASDDDREQEDVTETDLQIAKMRALYHFAYGLSHEFNNPLTNIATRAQTLLRDERDPDRRRRLAVINSQAFRAHEMLADLMLFAKPPALRRETVDLVAVARTVLAESLFDAREQGTNLELKAPTTCPLSADATQLGVALKAVVRNALEAVRAGGSVTITLRDEQAAAIAEITDTGPGIPAEIRPLVFDPFYSGREAGRGLGLGLSKCWRIAELHGGHVELDSPSGGGATIRIVLPK